MRFSKTAFSVFTALIAVPLAADAAVLQWSASQTNLTLAAGEQVTLTLYVNESGTPAQIAPEDGLLSVGFSITPRPSNNATLGTFAPNTAIFSEVISNSSTTTSAAFYGEIPFSATSGPIPDGSGNIILGTLEVIGGSAAGSFDFSDFGAGNQTVTVSGSGSLDSQIQDVIISVAVPEPAALGLLGITGMLLVRRRTNV